MTQQPQSLTIIRPDDWHLHLRDGKSLPLLVPHASKQLSRAIIMPNLVPPVCNIKDAKLYKDRILSNIPKKYSSLFKPLMTLYLTDNTSPQDIIDAKKSGIIYGCKLYPKGATTNSSNGVTNIRNIAKVLKQMEISKINLLIHGEVTDKHVDIFNKERQFIDTILPYIINNFPNLKIVLEHITTEYAVNFILNEQKNGNNNIAATITAHHLMSTRNDIFGHGINPHYYCLPILKSQKDKEALIKAAISGNDRFFAGSDSAPHEKSTKECCNGKAGIYTGYNTICLYAQTFSDHNALDKLEKFISINGAKYYGLPLNKTKITLKKQLNKVPDYFNYLNGRLIPYMAGKNLDWVIDETTKSKI